MIYSITPLLKILGFLILGLGLLLLVPLFLCINQFNLKVFLAFIYPSMFSITVGLILIFSIKKSSLSFSQSMIICGLAWIILSMISAAPYIFGIDKSVLNSFFEAVSGYTTTGITMFSGLDHYHPSILIWRSITQWLGGLGIITFFIAVTAKLVDPHYLFGAESHKIKAQRPVPGIVNTVKILWTIYIIFTAIIFVLLVLGGMPVFDSINHSFTALSTGGFSTHDQSIKYYQLSGYSNYRFIEYVLMLGMLMGAINFVVHYQILRGNIKQLWKNFEIKYFWGILISAVLLIITERMLTTGLQTHFYLNKLNFWSSAEQNFREIAFQVISVFTTTGFATEDISSPYFKSTAKILFLGLMFIGGCTGSTGGGVKVFRIAILSKIVKNEFFKILIPRSALNAIYINQEKFESSQIQRLLTIFCLWIFILLAGTIITSLFSNFSPIQSASGMFSAVCNIGPCYIPVDQMSSLHPVIKLTYIMGMIAGRLEIFPLFLIFSSKAWT
ncbi:MAG: hypothetical protein APR63_12130 [Desulfuromonas sp. SDB]|nr:MAG: hypothetical protein APR63_12130 [Desulfuromonas sp. SDB]